MPQIHNVAKTYTIFSSEFATFGHPLVQKCLFTRENEQKRTLASPAGNLVSLGTAIAFSVSTFIGTAFMLPISRSSNVAGSGIEGFAGRKV